MTRYSISTLEKLSGVKAHTIRIWEQRYKVLAPLRTETNIRYYDDAQLKKLLNIVTLLHNGYRISKVSKLSKEEMSEIVTSIVANPNKEPGTILALINKLISCGLCLDIQGFESVFRKVRKEFNTEDTYTKVLQPMLVKVGLLWSNSKMSPAQEHFLSNLVRQKLIAAIDTLPLPINDEKRWLLFLPPDEYHEIGLLYAHFLLRKYNNSVLYLGSNVPLKDLEVVMENYKPTHSLFFVIKNMTLRNGQKCIDVIRESLPDVKLLVSGNSTYLDKLELPESYIRLNDPDTFKTEYVYD